MSDKVMITCAVTGSGDTAGVHPNLPVTPAQIAQAGIEAAQAGATIVHIHVREPETGAGTHDAVLYREVVARLRDSAVDVVINLTTGMGGDFEPGAPDPATAGPRTHFLPPEERVEHVLELRPEICSLDVATMAFGDLTFINTPAHLTTMATLVREHGVKPELEVFDLGHIELAKRLVADGAIDEPPLFQLCLGIKWGAPADSATMMAMRDRLPADAIWSGFGISAQQFPMAAQAALLGGHIRVGLEDNLYLRRGVFATNAQLVERAKQIAEGLGREVMSPAEARRHLGLRL